MIRAATLTPAPTSPRKALAEALDGQLVGSDDRGAILVNNYVVWASLKGVVRVGGTPVGVWHDGTETLAAAVRAVIW